MLVDLSRITNYLEWMKEKIFLDSQATAAKSRIVKRGMVYWCKLGRGIGSEQEKERPCVVLQNNVANMSSPNTIVAPITHTPSTVDVVVPINNKYDATGTLILDGQALIGNIVTVSKARLGNEICALAKAEMDNIDKAIIKSLSIYEIIQTKENIISDKDKYIEILRRQREELRSTINKLESELAGKK